MDKPRISVIIPSKDRPQILQRTLEALLAALTGHCAEVILVNDSVTPLQIHTYEKDFIKIINNPKPGISSARNTGGHTAKADLLLFMDDDILVTGRHISRTLELHQQYTGCCFNFYWMHTHEQLKALPRSKFGRYILNNLRFCATYRLSENLKDENGFMVLEDGMSSQYLSVEKKYFIESGGYDENIQFGIEDILLAKRYREMGMKIYLSLHDVVLQNELNRLHLWGAMERFRTVADAKREGRDRGHREYDLRFSFPKAFLYALFSTVRKPLYILAEVLPDTLWLDPLYFSLVNLLLGTSTWQGFHQKPGK